MYSDRTTFLEEDFDEFEDQLEGDLDTEVLLDNLLSGPNHQVEINEIQLASDPDFSEPADLKKLSLIHTANGVLSSYYQVANYFLQQREGKGLDQGDLISDRKKGGPILSRLLDTREQLIRSERFSESLANREVQQDLLREIGYFHSLSDQLSKLSTATPSFLIDKRPDSKLYEKSPGVQITDLSMTSEGITDELSEIIDNTVEEPDCSDIVNQARNMLGLNDDQIPEEDNKMPCGKTSQEKQKVIQPAGKSEEERTTDQAQSATGSSVGTYPKLKAPRPPKPKSVCTPCESESKLKMPIIRKKTPSFAKTPLPPDSDETEQEDRDPQQHETSSKPPPKGPKPKSKRERDLDAWTVRFHYFQDFWGSHEERAKELNTPEFVEAMVADGISPYALARDLYCVNTLNELKASQLSQYDITAEMLEHVQTLNAQVASILDRDERSLPTVATAALQNVSADIRSIRADIKRISSQTRPTTSTSQSSKPGASEISASKPLPLSLPREEAPAKEDSKTAILASIIGGKSNKELTRNDRKKLADAGITPAEIRSFIGKDAGKQTTKLQYQNTNQIPDYTVRESPESVCSDQPFSIPRKEPVNINNKEKVITKQDDQARTQIRHLCSQQEFDDAVPQLKEAGLDFFKQSKAFFERIIAEKNTAGFYLIQWKRWTKDSFQKDYPKVYSLLLAISSVADTLLMLSYIIDHLGNAC